MHSFCALPTVANLDWILSTTDYGGQRYISMIQKGNVVAAQFHPEKSGTVGLSILGSFISRKGLISPSFSPSKELLLSEQAVANAGAALGLTDISELDDRARFPTTVLVKRVIACLDVRSNDQGDLVVTKGDQYDVRESGDGSGAK